MLARTGGPELFLCTHPSVPLRSRHRSRPGEVGDSSSAILRFSSAWSSGLTELLRSERRAAHACADGSLRDGDSASGVSNALDAPGYQNGIL